MINLAEELKGVRTVGMFKPVVSPNRRLQDIRRKCREKYFGSWHQVCQGETAYGPSGKSYSDYAVIEMIVTKLTGMLFKYSIGKANGSVSIMGIVNTNEDAEKYEKICEAVCMDLRQKIDAAAQRQGTGSH